MNHKSIQPFYPSSLFKESFINAKAVEQKEGLLCENRSGEEIMDLRVCYQTTLRKDSDYSSLQQQTAMAIKTLEVATEDIDHFEGTINSIYANVTTYIGSLFSVMALLFGGGLLFGSLSNESLPPLFLFSLTIVIGGIVFYLKNHAFNEAKVAIREEYRNAIICFSLFSDCLCERIKTSQFKHKQ